MSARNQGPPPEHHHEPPFPRGFRGVPNHPAFREEMRESHYSLSGQRQLPPHPALFEKQLAAQHDDIQLLLVDNQRLAATHVALKQELEAAQHEIQRGDKFARNFHSEKELEMRELYEKSLKLENELHGVNAARAELMQVHTDIKELTASKQELTAQVQMMTQDLTRVTSDLQQVPTIKAEIDGLRQELERTMPAIEHQKNGFAESFEHGKAMENKLITMAREMEKLRAELANAGKARAAANQGMSYYGNPPQSGYPGNPYPVGYGMLPANSMPPAPGGVEGYPQYAPGPATWGSYNNMQQGPR